MDKWKWLARLSVLFVLLYGIGLYVLSCIGRNEPRSLVDYGIVWGSAWELAKNNQVVNETYFLKYSNNIKPMLILSLLLRIGFKLGMSDPFYFVLLFTVLQVLVAIWGVSVLAGETKYDLKLPILVMFVFCLPIWATTQAFYTDAMSFSFSIVVLALFYKIQHSDDRNRRLMLAIVAGILLAIGINIKITVCIPLIAFFIVFFLVGRKGERKYYPIEFVAVGIGFFATYFLIDRWAESYEITRLAQETADPILAWIALGLKGDGSFYQNREWVYQMQSLDSKAEKLAFCKEYICENWKYLFDAKHLAQKVDINYASGHLGNTDYTYYAMYDNNILWELFAPYGRYYWRTSQFSFCYVHSIYVICFLGGALNLVRYIKRKTFSAWLMVIDLSILGYFVFLMLWEANNRQLYNLVPILITAALLHGYQIVEWTKEYFSGKLKIK